MLKLRKILFSVSLFSVSLLTMVATTFAWVGITSNSVFDDFSLNLKTDNDTGNYGIQLSLTGIPSSFSDSIDGISIRRQILKNTGRYGEYNLDNASDDLINALFSKFEMGQCTPKKTDWTPNIFSSNDVQLFENVTDGRTTNFFIYFDVYASLYVAKATSDPTAETTPISLFLRDGILSSNEIGTWKLNNSFTYPTTSITIGGVTYPSHQLSGHTIHGTVRTNPASAARVCIQRFEPVDLYSGYPSNTTGYTIYKYDDDLPTYDNVNDIYSFGGILPAEHNMAQQQFRSIQPDVTLPEVPEWQINRGDVKYEDVGDVGRLVYPEDGLTVGKKIKFRVYFWFEGWDADCFEVIDRRSVNVNLAFSNKGPSDI